ncbi:MAG: dual specificity phosphatase [Edafosvirus sp.]|uniref:Dual specificity phosphatase n=1 Tax=Edafosvirus sp. TaxID=2487765 RepID=A0A3G4ZVU6_9VIRU|nr:MAG: dual specificity phosphatase [Edafosvirus sp.]
MLKNISNYTLSFCKVAYDQTVNLVAPDVETFNECKNDIKLSDHIDTNKYQNENENTKLYPLSSYKTEFLSFIAEPTYITDNIYLGSAFNASNYELLKRLNIKLIINATKDMSNYYPAEFKYVKIPVKDNNSQSIYEHLEPTYKIIKDFQLENKDTSANILIHCFMGASRSASVVLYYLLRETQKTDKKLTYSEALESLQKKRSLVNPSFRFAKDVIKCINDQETKEIVKKFVNDIINKITNESMTNS